MLSGRSKARESVLNGREATESLELRIEPRVRRAAEKAAAEDGRSLASLVEMLLIDHLRARGFLRGPGSDEGLRPDQLTAENDG